MIGQKILKYMGLLLRLLVGLTFIYASYHKIIYPAEFAKVIYGYYLFPEFSINLIAIFLPYIELFAGIALIFNIYPKGAVIIINLMLTGFIIAISINLIRGHEFDCGCYRFGEAGHKSSALLLLFRDIGYFICGIIILKVSSKNKITS